MYFLFDIGATRMRLGVSKDATQVDDYRVVDTPNDYGAALEAIQLAAETLAPRQTFKLAVGGLPGPLSPLRDKLLRIPHLPAWENKPILADIAATLGCKVVLENDTALVGLGEAVSGAGIDHQIVAYLSISTGIGGARIVNKYLDEAYQSFEPGHHIIHFGLGNKLTQLEHIEEFVSGSAIKSKFNVEPFALHNKEFWEEAHQSLAVLLHNVTCFWSPQVIVMGGGLVSAKLINLTKLKQYWQQIPSYTQGYPELRQGKLGNVGGLFGALVLLQQKLSQKA